MTRPSAGISTTSAPAQNARPAPVTIAIQTDSSDSTAAYAAFSSRTISGLTALSLSGRLNVIVAIRSSTS
jgi:hypothetical protein